MRRLKQRRNRTLLFKILDMFNSFPGSLHSDVLNASPTTDEDKGRLVEEIRSRAKGSINSKNYPEAIQLYSKALEIISKDDKNGIAILYGNISMCYNNMNKVTDAINSANDAIKNDSQYVKAYYRKAMAYINQKDYNLAKEALLDGIKIKPDDKEIIMQLDRVQTELIKIGNVPNNNGNKIVEQPNSTSTTSITPPLSSSSSKISSSPSSTGTAVTTSSKSLNTDSTIENDDEEKIIRGYKIVDGKKTTFFNHTLDEKTKELIGDIQPKKIEAAAELDIKNPVGTSVWNTAGTFESVGHTPWAKETLENLLKDIKLESDNIIVSIKEVKEINGDAEITSNRGKRKHIYDFSITLVFSLVMNENTTAYDGEIKIDDVTADGDFEFSFSYDKKNSNYNAEIEKVIKSQVKSTRGLKALIIERLNSFDKSFKSK